MGNQCPCGVIVNASAANKHVRFLGHRGTVKGDLTYQANVCVDRLQTSTLSLKFIDKDCDGRDHSFQFIADTILEVDCVNEGNCCLIGIIGSGTVNGARHDFAAIFMDQAPPETTDRVKLFVIDQFFDQNGIVSVPQGTIMNQGCS
ncbi:hypothetical protein ACFQ38_00765 [Sporosarcina contaminans]|uniref:Spore coat protein Z n=1 Tax=Sporosarcina contaminans TaxID=633403 RepID=A0ABW3TTU9_9BACL